MSCRNSDPRRSNHPKDLVFQNQRVKIGGVYYTYALCPKGCNNSVLRRLNRCSWKEEIPTSFTSCRSCSMLGKKNRTPTYQIGDRWKTQDYWLTKLPDGTIIHVARVILAEKLGRPLTAADRVRFLDKDPDNLSPENLILESELVQNEPFLFTDHRKTPLQVAKAALERLRSKIQ